MNIKAARSEVYAAIDGERAYQEAKWTPDTTTADQNHSFEEWFVYINDYTAEALHQLSRLPKQEADVFAAHNMRKVAGLAVAALENNGVVER